MASTSSAKLSKQSSTWNKGSTKKRLKKLTRKKSQRKKKFKGKRLKITKIYLKKHKRHGGKWKASNCGLPPRSKSTNSRPSKPQTRTLRANMSSSSDVYKTHSDTSLSNGMRNLAIRTHSAGSSSSGASRRYNSNRGTYQTLEDIAQNIIKKQAKNIVVMAGAGISTSSGIPDFRTPGTGLYDNLSRYHIPYPQAIFDINYFQNNPKPFYTLAKELYPTGQYRPNYVHYFLRMLHEKGLLLRLYTQNIDGLERMCGIPSVKLVEAHGTFLTASCVRCKHSHPPEEVRKSICNCKVPRCKRSACHGMVKPDIVFFGEDLPRRFYYYLRDFPQADLLLVMGTSLEVEPFAGIVDATRMYVPRVLFNRHPVGPFIRKRRMNDFISNGDLTERIKSFVQLLGWKTDLDTLIKKWEKELDIQFPVSAVVSCDSNGSFEDVPDNIDAKTSQVCGKDTTPCVADEKEATSSESGSSSSSDASSAGSSQSSLRSKPPRGPIRALQRNGVQSDVTQRLFHTRNSLLVAQRQRNAKSQTSQAAKKSAPTTPVRGTRPAVPARTVTTTRTISTSARAQLEAGVVYRLAQRASQLTVDSKSADPKTLPKITYSHRSDVNKDTRIWRLRTAKSSSDESSDSSCNDEEE